MSIAHPNTLLVAIVALLASGCGGGAPQADPDIRSLNNRAVWNRYSSGEGAAPRHPAAEVDAIDAMISHHRDAVGGACAWLSEHGASNNAVADTARQIVRIQTAQIDSMESWRSEWYPGEPHTAVWQPMFPGNALATDTFLETMIAHHEHGVAMYEAWVGDGSVVHDELGHLARRIAQGQTGEIARMEQLLRHPTAGSDPTPVIPVQCEP